MFQKRLAPFRVPIFNRLAADPRIRLEVVTTSQSVEPEAAFGIRTLPTVPGSLGGRRFVLQRRLLHEARRHDVLLVEGSIRFLSALLLTLLSPIHRTPVVWWTSLYDPRVGRVVYPRGFKGLVTRCLLHCARAIVVYSESAATAVRNVSPERQIFVAPNSLDVECLSAAESRWLCESDLLADFRHARGFGLRPVVLFVGRLVPAKRVDELLRAFAILREDIALEPILAIVGDGVERPNLEAQARDLGIAADVRFYGEIREPQDVCPYFLCARVFALPAAGGLAVYQALAHGVPVVATSADGTERDLVDDGETGFICDPGDLTTFAARLGEIVGMSDARWTDVSMRCRELTRGRRHSRNMVHQLRAAVASASDRLDLLEPAGATRPDFPST